MTMVPFHEDESWFGSIPGAEAWESWEFEICVDFSFVFIVRYSELNDYLLYGVCTV
jgi:hypothetical protein